MLNKIPLVKNYFIDLDQNVKKFGLTKGFNKFLSKLNSKLIVNNLNRENLDILSKKPCLIIATHPFQLEMVPVIGSIPERKDIYLIMTFELFGLCPNVDKKCLPLYIKHSPIESYKEKFLNLFLKYFHKTKSFEKDIAHQKNIKTISKSAKMINKGNCVIIFPDARGKNFNWKPGIGWLINEITNKDAYYIFVYMKPSIFDYLRYLFLLGKIFPSFTVDYSNAKKISYLTGKNVPPKQIALNLEKEYNNWVESL